MSGLKDVSLKDVGLKDVSLKDVVVPLLWLIFKSFCRAASWSTTGGPTPTFASVWTRSTSWPTWWRNWRLEKSKLNSFFDMKIGCTSENLVPALIPQAKGDNFEIAFARNYGKLSQKWNKSSKKLSSQARVFWVSCIEVGNRQIFFLIRNSTS